MDKYSLQMTNAVWVSIPMLHVMTNYSIPVKLQSCYQLDIYHTHDGKIMKKHVGQL